MKKLLVIFFVTFLFSRLAFSQELHLSIQLDKAVYPTGDSIPAVITLVNETNRSLWIKTACGSSVSELLEKNGFDWEEHWAHPTKLCVSAPLALVPFETVEQEVDIAGVFAPHSGFSVGPGVYKFKAFYTFSDPVDFIENPQDLIWREVHSDEFKVK